MGRKIMDQYEPEKVRAGKILHYHDMMWPEAWPTLLEKLKADRPDVHDWLSPMGPLREPGSKIQRVFSKGAARAAKTEIGEAHRRMQDCVNVARARRPCRATEARARRPLPSH